MQTLYCFTVISLLVILAYCILLSINYLNWSIAGVGTWVQHPGRGILTSRAARQIAGNGDSQQQRRSAMGWCGARRKDRAQVWILLRLVAVVLAFVFNFVDQAGSPHWLYRV